MQLDTGDALEAEAARRAAVLKDAVVIEGDTRKFARQLKWSALLLGVIAFFHLFVAVATPSLSMFFLSLLYIAETWLILHTGRRVAQAPKPHLTISAIGIAFDTPYFGMDQVFWDEIKSVRTINLLGTRYIEIKLKEPEVTCKHTLQTHDLPFSGLRGVRRWVCTVFPIQIPGQLFDASAKEIAAQVARFRPDAG